ncbi:hypothetical protein HY745_06530 [Candidatus Desantisbacteria bacterium]|nr:hypothetical protein [Candidatus Desantisbacteria bacterium]
MQEEDIYELFNNGEITEEEKNNMLYLLASPIDINHDPLIRIASLPGADIELAEKIIRLREKINGFKSLSDLIALPEISENRISMWQSFILIFPLQKNYFYQKIKYQDDLNKTYEPYISDELFFRSGKYYIGILGIYNPGKKIEDKNGIHKYFIFHEGNSLLKKLIIGNYKAGFGSGVTLSNSWQNYNEFIYDNGIENKFYGIGIKIKPDKKISATYIYSMPIPNTEQKYENILNGINLNYEIKDSKWDAGITWYQSKLINSFDSTSYKTGKKYISAYGAYSDFILNPYLFSFEISQIKTGSNGELFKIDAHFPKTKTLFIYRSYDKDFINPYSASFSASDDEPDNSDEMGIYLKLTHRLSDEFEFGGYYDLWKHPSTAMSGTRKNVQFKSFYGKYLCSEFYRTWKTDDIKNPVETNNGMQFQLYFNSEWKFLINFWENTNDYLLNRKYSLKLFYRLSKISLYEYQIKKEENDIHHTDKYILEQYLQYKIILSKNGQIVLRLTDKDYSNEYRKEKDYKLNLELRLLW